MIHPSVQNY